MEGKVLWFKKTYGFIRADESNEDLFFYWTDIETNDEYKVLYSGDRVTFDAVSDARKDGEDRLRAINVSKTTRLSVSGKPLLRLSYAKAMPNVNIAYISTYVLSKTVNGLRFLNVIEDIFVATDVKLEKKELEKLYPILKSHNIINKYIYTGNESKYDFEIV